MIYDLTANSVPNYAMFPPWTSVMTANGSWPKPSTFWTVGPSIKSDISQNEY